MYSILENRRKPRSGRLKDESYREFLRKHCDALDKARQDQVPLDQLSPSLLNQIADERNLRIAWDRAKSNGDKSPGPDGLRFRDVDPSEVWDFVKLAGHTILGGSYRPGGDRVVEIPKLSGNGSRTLTLQNIFDRVVARAIKQILEPIFDSGFVDQSCGYRSGRNGTQHALAQAEFAVVEQRRYFVVTEDIRDAFDQVPHGRLINVLRCHGLPDDVVNLIERSIDNPSRRGLRQGSPLSPLLLNVYLDHFLDQWWRIQHPKRPLIRMVDDLLLPCESRVEACRLREEFAKKLQYAGMPLKGSARTSILNLRSGRKLRWLGYEIELGTSNWKVRIASKAWQKVECKLTDLHRVPQSPRRALRVVDGWLKFLGPMFEHENRPVVLQRINGVAAGSGFEEIPPATWLESSWEKAAARWSEVRAKVRTGISGRMTNDVPPGPTRCSTTKQSGLVTIANDKSDCPFGEISLDDQDLELDDATRGQTEKAVLSVLNRLGSQ